MPKAPKKAWSLLAYIAGDNDLSDAGLIDIREMCRVGAGPKVHAAVQIDTAGEVDGSIRYEITEPDWSGKAYRTVIERLPESDTGDPQVLREFLQWGLARYPASKRLVVVWNHGSGFHTPRRRNIGYDDNGTSLDMPELASALTKAGLGPKNRLAILGFDACLMCMLEICHHVAPFTELVVGSQQTEPNNGWPYHRVLKAMGSDPAPEALGAAIVEAYISSYRAAGEEGVTQSAIRTSATEAAMAALSDLGRALLADGAVQAMRALRTKVQIFDWADYVDLIHLARLVSRRVPKPKSAAAAKALETAAEACMVVAKAYGSGVSDAHGLSCWFPADAQTYHAFRGAYLRMRLGSIKALRGWVEFLDAYFA